MTEVVSLHSEDVPAKRGFQPTQTQRDFINLLKCCHGGELGIMVAAAGIGKTWAIEHYVKTSKNAFRIHVTESSRGLVSCLARTAHAIGTYDPNRGAYSLREVVVSQLDSYWGRKLLIFDEAQRLQDDAIEEIRSLYDEVEDLGVVLAGNPSLLDRWSNKSANKRGMWAQLVSRIGPMLNLAAPLPEDVDSVCDQFGNVSAAARKRLKKLVLGPGGLRDVVAYVEKAGKFAEGGPIKPCHIEDAIQVRGGRT